VDIRTSSHCKAPSSAAGFPMLEPDPNDVEASADDPQGLVIAGQVMIAAIDIGEIGCYPARKWNL